ncbi:MAG: hypothetical protein MJZ90_09315 [Bacteroidales bacterium]|nr:hypothetical protein [Bacteroidales bacterium]
MVYSFDIFDTCLVRKCGTPESMLDVLSLRVFKEPVEEWVRQEFVVARKTAQDKVWEETPFISIVDIYNAMDFRCPQLKEKEELIQIEKNLEKELLVPVLEMRERINKLRSKGNHIIYISDMYLSDELIRNKMSEYDFLKGNDTLYVSGTIGKLKQDGSLFEYVRMKEGLSFRNWKHIGDSKHNDYTIPRKLGIKAELVNWGVMDKF